MEAGGASGDLSAGEEVIDWTLADLISVVATEKKAGGSPVAVTFLARPER